jgi:PilZ domain
MIERRKHARVSATIDGRWLGASGGATCQVENISLGGCFVRTSAPSVEGMGVIRLILGGKINLTIVGRVVHAERGHGFGVQFRDISLDARMELERHLGELRAALVA